MWSFYSCIYTKLLLLHIIIAILIVLGNNDHLPSPVPPKHRKKKATWYWNSGIVKKIAVNPGPEQMQLRCTSNTNLSVGSSKKNNPFSDCMSFLWFCVHYSFPNCDQKDGWTQNCWIPQMGGCIYLHTGLWELLEGSQDNPIKSKQTQKSWHHIPSPTYSCHL